MTSSVPSHSLNHINRPEAQEPIRIADPVITRLVADEPAGAGHGGHAVGIPSGRTAVGVGDADARHAETAYGVQPTSFLLAALPASERAGSFGTPSCLFPMIALSGLQSARPVIVTEGAWPQEKDGARQTRRQACADSVTRSADGVRRSLLSCAMGRTREMERAVCGSPCDYGSFIPWNVRRVNYTCIKLGAVVPRGHVPRFHSERARSSDTRRYLPLAR